MTFSSTHTAKNMGHHPPSKGIHLAFTDTFLLEHSENAKENQQTNQRQKLLNTLKLKEGWVIYLPPTVCQAAICLYPHESETTTKLLLSMWMRLIPAALFVTTKSIPTCVPQ